MLRLEPRPHPSTMALLLSPVLAIGLTLLAGLILFALLGFDPIKTLTAYFIKPLDSLYGLSELTVKATPLLLCAIGLALGFRANIWNIGAEGQLIMGAVAGSGVALFLRPDTGAPWVLPAMFLAFYPQLQALNIMQLHSPQSAILSAIIFNALIIVALIPLALKGVSYRAAGAASVLRRNLVIYGLGGIIVPFIGIKLVDIAVTAFGLA